MKIALHIFGSEGGGVATYNRTLIRILQSKGHQVCVISNDKGRHYEELSGMVECQILGHPSTPVPGRNLFGVRVPDPVSLAKLARARNKVKPRVASILQNSAPDAVITNGFTGALFLTKACQQQSIKLFPILHGNGTPENDVMNMRSRLAARVLNRCTAVVSISQKTVERYIPFLKVPYKLVYNSVENFTPDPDARQQFLNERDLPPQTRILGTISRISPEKALLEFVDAMHLIRQETDESICAVITGAPNGKEQEEYFSKIKNKIKTLNLERDVYLTGRSTPDTFFGIVDLFCHLHLATEPFGLTLIEAMQSGVPVIASDRGGPVEILGEGKFGILGRTEDPAILSKLVIETVFDDKRMEDLKELGLNRFSRMFTTDRWYSDWIELLEK